jgi:uncharacterized SAM-binding protein YcdF (DUF218 family)
VWLKSFLSLLVLPPVNLVFALVVGLILLRHAPRLAHWLIGVATALLLVLGMPAVAGALMYPLELGLPTTPPPDKPPGAIVILGGDVARLAHGQATVGPLSLERVLIGAELQHKTQLPILITGGDIAYEPPPVADVMRDTMVQDFKTPVRWVENRSRDTWENARDSAAILRANGIDSIYLVTQPWHERRALLAFAGTGITVTAAPGPLHRPPQARAEDFVPQVSAWATTFFAMHEWIGCLWYTMP